MPNQSLNYPASAMLKSASTDYKPKAEYTSYNNSAAKSFLEHIESSIVMKRDAQNANKREWQLRCISEYNHTHNITTSDSSLFGTPIVPPNEMLRVLVVNGAMTMFALTKAIAQTFGLTDKPYTPQPSKGTLPPGSHWQLLDNMSSSENVRAALIGNQKNVYKAAGKGAPFFDEKKIKVYQLFRKRGDTLVFRCTGRGGEQKQVTVCLDGYDQSQSRFYNARITLRCVGADRHLPTTGWNFLNAKFLQNKQLEKQWCLIVGNPTEDELDDIPEEEKTKHGYLKDGFVVDSSETDDNADDDDDDSMSSNVTTSDSGLENKVEIDDNIVMDLDDSDMVLTEESYDYEDSN